MVDRAKADTSYAEHEIEVAAKPIAAPLEFANATLPLRATLPTSAMPDLPNKRTKKHGKAKGRR